MTAADSPEHLHFRAAGVSLLLELADRRLPAIRHWGADLGDLSAAQLAAVALAGEPAFGDTFFDVATTINVLPEHAAAWVGRPGLEGARSRGRDWSSAFRTTGPDAHRVEVAEDGTQQLSVDAVDPVAQLSVRAEIQLTASGLVRLRATLRNDQADDEDADPYTLGALRLALPVPTQAGELLDFTGRHSRERAPQRRAFTVGLHSRETRMGRTGLDSATLLVAGEPGFAFRTGEAWGVHLAWSGNQNVYAEQLYNGARLLGGGELLDAGELVLDRGQSYTSPWLVGSYGHGLDALADRIHAFLRARPQHPQRPRPVILNTWEAVYFAQNYAALAALAERGAAVGAERFVLDDGWFGGRRDDRSSLGDWHVSPEVWPDGLGPLIEKVTSLGMEFGLWVEPEMVNLDSDLARAHPEWLFSAGGRTGLPSRYQHVLDLGHAEAYAYLFERLDALLTEYDIAYLKWDHNRNLNDAGHTPYGEPGVHRHTRAVYRLFDELKAAHPGLEIESCAGGGGRIDLGVIEHTDRVWASDCIDALERQQIQRYTQLIMPPELIGTHIGSPHAHTTMRHHDLSFRAATAIWGHLGIEWDLTKISDAELAEVKEWVDLHKSVRDLLHSGIVVNADHPDPAIWAHGVVAQDGRDALYAVTAVDRSITWPPGRLRLPGLEPELTYEVALVRIGRDHEHVNVPPWANSTCRLTGRALEVAGLEIVAIHPEHSYLIRVRAV